MLEDANTGVGGAKVDTDGSFLLSDHDWCFINKPLEEVKLLEFTHFQREERWN